MGGKMNYLALLSGEAATAASAEGTAKGGGVLGMVGMIAIYGVIIFAMWFFFMRPQKKEQKRVKEMLNAMAVGDCVLTTSGFYGTSAVLEDAISLKFYFFGAQFDSATATVNGEAAALETQDAQYFVKAPISAKDFDKAITVEIAGVGSVTDSAEAYTARVGSGENEYKLVQALRAYGADAKRFAAAKAGA